MISNKELYGTDNVPMIPRAIADTRIKLLKARLAELLDIHFMKQDNNLIKEVTKAIDFWTQLRDGETTEGSQYFTYDYIHIKWYHRLYLWACPKQYRVDVEGKYETIITYKRCLGTLFILNMETTHE